VLEPRFEHDFPPGSDIVGDILHGPQSAERMEFELFNRLAAQVEIERLVLLMQELCIGALASKGGAGLPF
jgi:hypothetical protein